MKSSEVLNVLSFVKIALLSKETSVWGEKHSNAGWNIQQPGLFEIHKNIVLDDFV